MSNSFFLTLEPRIVFDGAGAATAIESADSSEIAKDTQDASHDVDMTAPAALAPSDVNRTSEIAEIAFIDMRIPQAQELAASMRDNVMVVMIDPAKDGLVQVDNALAEHNDIQTIHLYTHGDSNGFRIGSTSVTNETIGELSNQLSGWSGNLSANADILFYGCDLAQTAQGQSLLNQIGTLTGADISASTDLTGSETLGGNWALEFQTGTIESSLSITETGMASYNSILAAMPQATLTAPAQDPLIGEQITFTVTFDNTSATDTGFSPYINLFLPAAGVDGVYNAATNTFTSAADGISFVNATFLGTNVDTSVITLEDINASLAGIQFAHPLAVDTSGNPLIVTLDNGLGIKEGDQLVILQLPFGSYTPDQPAIDIEITANLSTLADAGAPLNIYSNAGFALGNTALNDFNIDPSLQAATLGPGNTSSVSITPQLFRVNTTLNAPEGETATGSNFERGYTIEIEVADGQTLENASLDFVFSESMVFTGGSATGGGILDTSNLTQTLGGDLSDDVLTVNFAGLTGTQTINASFFVSEFDQSGDAILNPLTGASKTLGEASNIRLSATATPFDARDLPGTITNTYDSPQIIAKSLATQKSVTIQNDTGDAGLTPGDALQYTINIQISDFFAFDTLMLEDIFDDGQILDGAFTPTFSVTRQGSADGTFTFTNGLDFTQSIVAGDDQLLDFNLSTLLSSALGSGILEGGQFGADTLGGTTATLTFRTIVQDSFDSSPDNLNLLQNDTIGNDVTLEGRMLDAALTALAGPVILTDTSSTSLRIQNNKVDISVFALNGSTTGDITTVKPGDDVTFRLTYNLVTGDFKDFTLDAYLPLPIFSVDDINADGIGGDTFSLNNASLVPSIGNFRYGPTNSADITAAIPTPGLIADTNSNFIRFDLGNFDDPANDGGTVDILFTVRAGNQPFADGLKLTTFARQSDDNSLNVTTATNDLTQITLQEPEINRIVKGVIATDDTDARFTRNPQGVQPAGDTSANPLTRLVNSSNLSSLNLNSNLRNIDSGGLVRFAIIVENTGSSPNGAFDITINDTLPTGFEIPAGGINLRVVNGAGTALAVETASPETALFAGGIKLTDSATGALSAFNATSGENIVIITYDLVLQDPAEASQTIINTATLSNFSNSEGGPDFTPVDISDTASVRITRPSIEKTIIGTDQPSTTGNNVVVGEIVQYSVRITIPEGISSLARLTDTLSSGMAFVSIDSITASSGDLTTDMPGGFAAIQSNADIRNSGSGLDDQGRQAFFDFRTITNANRDNSINETITITYSTVVLNTAAINDGTTLRNGARWVTQEDNRLTRAPNLSVVEPRLNVTVTPDNARVDADDTVTYTVVLQAPSTANATAFDIDFNNVIPSGLTYIPGSFAQTGGIVADALTENGGNFNATFAMLAPGQSATFTFMADVNDDVAINDRLTTTATATFQSIPGDLLDPTPHNTRDTERTGAGGINDYIATGNGNVDIFSDTVILTLDDTSESATPGAQVVPGEIVRYRFVMQIPETTTLDYRVEALIPSGLQFLNDGTATVAFVSDGTFSANGAGLAGNGLVIGNETTLGTIDPTFVIPAGLITGAAFGDGTDPVFRLGDLTNLDNDINQEFVIIEFNALVLNTATVDNGDILPVTARATEGTTLLETSNTVNINVVEPAITNLNKQVIDTNGTTATYQITFNNTSPTDAFDVNVFDALPANLTNLQNIVITPAGGVSGITNNSTASALNINISDIPAGSSVTITYTADVTDNTAPVANTNANITWTSIDGEFSSLSTAAGTSTGGLTGSQTGERTGTGGINDYITSEGAGLNVISGTLFVDANANNAIDGGETRLANTQINLLGAGSDGIFGNADDITLSTLTNANGEYNFGALPAGDYRISLQPSGQPNGLNADFAPSFDPSGNPTDALIARTLGEGITSANNIFAVADIRQPPAGTDNTASITEGQTLSFTAADFGFTDPDIGDTFTNVIIDTLPPSSIGTLTLNGVPLIPGQVIAVADIPNLLFTQNPALNPVAGTTVPTSFTFSVQDQTGRTDPTPNTFGININATDFAPSGADNTKSINEGQTLGFTAADFGFTDPDIGDTFANLTINTLPPSSIGTLTLNGVPLIPGQTITVSDITNLVFIPNPTVDPAFGTSVSTGFTFSVIDQTGRADPTPNNFAININGINDTIPFVIPPEFVPPGELPDPFGPPEFQVIPFQDINFRIDPARPDLFIAGTVGEQLLIEEKLSTFQVSRSVFTHSNPSEQLSYEAEMVDGSPLPDWLTFDSGDLSFTGKAPFGSPEKMEVVIIAKDTRNNEVKAPIRVTINDAVQDLNLIMPAAGEPEFDPCQTDTDITDIKEGNVKDDQENKDDCEDVKDEEQNADTQEPKAEGTETQDNSEQPAEDQQPAEAQDTEEEILDDKEGRLDHNVIPFEGRPSFSDQLQQHTRHAELQQQATFLRSIA